MGNTKSFSHEATKRLRSKRVQTESLDFCAGPNTDPKQRPSPQLAAYNQQPQRLHPSSQNIEAFKAMVSELTIKLDSALEEIRRKENIIKELDSEAYHLRLR